MIWQRLINHLSGQPSKSIRGNNTSKDGRGTKSRRRLKLETLQKRELLASDLGAISGVAYIDANGDSIVDAGETRLQNVVVKLWVDNNMDGQQDGGDTQVGTLTTGADGSYRFTNLDGDDDDVPLAPINQTDDGAYVLTFAAGAGGVQDPAGDPIVGVQLPGDIARIVTDDTGTTAAVIDQFLQEQPGQPITQNTAGNTSTSSSGALTSGGDVIGDERDVEVFVNAATSGDSQFSVVTGTTQLVFSNGGDVQATLLVQYDGVDADGAGLNRDVAGLANADLTDGEDISVGGILLAVRGDQVVTDGMEVRVFTNATDFSIATVDLPSNIAASNPLEIFVAFSDFVADAGGTGADFTDVGAIEVFVDGVNSNGGAGAPSLDLFVSVLETQKSTEYVTNAAATLPLILGGEVFVDNGAGLNQALQNNGIKDGTEPVFLAPGADKVTVQLFDVDPSGGGQTPIATTELDLAADANPGQYEFSQVSDGAGGMMDLGPGSYFVVIPASEFSTGQPLVGFMGSSVDTPGNAGADTTDDDVDDDNDGVFVAGVGFISGVINLTVGGEPTNGNENTTVDFGVLPVTDLRIDKTINNAASNLNTGGTAVFFVTVSNLGDSDATDVSVSDFLPDELTLTGVVDGSSNPVATVQTTVNGQTVETFTVGNLGAGNSETYTVTTTIAGVVPADPTNEVRISGYEVEVDADANAADRAQGDPLDGALENNIAIELVDVPLAELTVTKTDNLQTVNAGGSLTYEIVVTNTSTDVAFNVTAIDVLPAGVTFDSGQFTVGNGTVVENTTVGDPNFGNIEITFNNLASNESETVQITVDVDPDFVANPSELNNSVTATADNAPDVNDTDVTTVDRLVDVTVVKTVVATRTPDDRTDGDDTDDIVDNVAPFTPVAGGFMTYQVVVSNSGPSQARGVTATDTLDDGLTLVPGSFDAGATGVTLTENGQDLEFNIPGDTLDPAESLMFTFEVEIGSDEFEQIPNIATIATTDPQGANAAPDSSTVNVIPAPQVDLILTKGVALNQVDAPAATVDAVPGRDQVVYTLTVSHDVDSVSDAINVDVTDTLPVGLTGVMITAPNSVTQNFNTTTRQVLVEYTSIPVGETRTITITANVDADATGNIDNDAEVSVPGVTELDLQNNDDTARVTLTPEFDLTIDKSVNGSTDLGPADNVTFQIVVSHDLDDDGTEADNGESPSAATGVIVTDVLPDGLTFVSATSGGVAVTPTSTANGTIVFPSFDLAPAANRVLTVVASVDDDTPTVTTLTNTASHVTDAGETDATTNNSDSVDVTVTPVAEITVTKSVDVATAQTGTQLTYTVTVSNTGLSPAQDVVATDTLPAGVTFDSGTGPSGALSANGQQVVLPGVTLAAGDNFQFTIVATVNDGVTADQVNTVNVTTTTAEDGGGTGQQANTASATTAIDQAINEISGRVFLDANENGVQDAGEEGIEGVGIQLSGGGLAAPITQETDANGDYLFADLAAGTYQIQRVSTPAEVTDGLETAGPGATPADSGTEIANVTVPDNGANAAPENLFALEPVVSKRRFLASFLRTPGVIARDP